MSDSAVAFAVLLGLVALHRLAELVVSAVRLGRRKDALVPEPWLFPAMVVLHTGILTAPLAEVVTLGREFSLPVGISAGVVLIVATALRVWTLRTIGGAWNARVVLPENEAVVASGPYAWIRHPNYLVVILEVACLPLLHSAWISALVLSLLNGLVLYSRINTEEAALNQLPAWRDAMQDKPRLLPRFWRAVAE